jgi:hypothetical protein
MFHDCLKQRFIKQFQGVIIIGEKWNIVEQHSGDISDFVLKDITPRLKYPKTELVFYAGIIVSRVRGSMTNNNGFWIGWLDLLALLLQLLSILTAHNQWLSATRSIPYWTTSVFSSTVTDLVLIYESVTYESLRTNEEWRMKTHLRLNSRINYVSPFSNFRSRDSVVGIPAGYGLDDKEIGVRVPVGSRIFTFHVVQTGSGVHPTSYTMDTGGTFPGVKWQGRESDNSTSN